MAATILLISIPYLLMLIKELASVELNREIGHFVSDSSTAIWLTLL